MRRPRLTRRRILVIIVAIPIVLFGAGYAVLAIMTRNAPPPPSFNRSFAAPYQASLDGIWYDVSCHRRTIAGGWLLPQTADGAPIDLQHLHLGDVRWPALNLLRLQSLTLRRVGRCG
jgi:hypothetical protein